MDYEKKYKEALERAKEKYTKCYSPALLEYIFPELKENKDIEIKKDIISNLKRYVNCIKDGYDASSAKDFVVKEIEKQIAWLKKQGEQKQDPCEYCKDKCLNCYNFPCIDKRAFEQGKSVFEAIKEEKVDNQNCVKSIYNDEPKFKVGDWICNDMCDAHIASIEDGMYYFDEGDGLSIVFVDEHYHLWTIQDAMDGDVLFHSDSASNGIFIFKEIIDKGFAKEVICYCDYDSEDHFCLGEHHTCCWTDAKILYPATKEQRDLLFQKMKEAEYIFDFKNKELKKIKNDIEIPFGAKDSELQEATYFIPKGFHAEIDDDFVIIKKGEPTTWNKEDEELVKWSINNLTELKDRFGEEYGKVGKCIDWLKSLK